MSAAAFLSARDFLIANRTDYARAIEEFRWPRLTQFNWALDYFDLIAADKYLKGQEARQKPFGGVRLTKAIPPGAV